jgi:hypothetical protein
VTSDQRCRLAWIARVAVVLMTVAGAAIFAASALATTQAELTASDGAANDGLGWSVAYGDGIAVAGAPLHADSTGAVYVYAQSNGNWDQVAELAPATTAPQFTEIGRNVAISSDGSTIVVGGQGGVGSPGIVYVYSRPPGGWGSGTQPQRPASHLTTTDGVSGLGEGTAGNTVAVNANGTVVAAGASGTTNGSAYVWTMPAGGWGTGTQPQDQTAELGVSGITADAEFGDSIALAGNTVVVGAPFANAGVGGAYVFAKPAGGWGSGAQPQQPAATLDASPVAGSEPQFGSSASISADADTIAIGAQEASESNGTGAIYVYSERPGGWGSGPSPQTQTATLAASPSDTDGSSQLGYSVALSSDGATVLGGAPYSEDAYAFRMPAGGWGSGTQPQTESQLFTESNDDELGWSVAMSTADNSFLAGAIQEDVTVGVASNRFQGAAWVFTTAPGPQAVTGTATAAGSAFTLAGTVNPEAAATTYQLEYVPDSSFQLSGWAAATKVPVPGGAVGSDSTNHTESQTVTGLAADTLYDFRIVANNANGTSVGATVQFSTSTPVILPAAPTNVTATTATLHWTVRPAGEDLVNYAIACDTVHGSLPAVHKGPLSTPAGAVPADQGSHPLATPITGLRAHTQYRCDLTMTDQHGQSHSSTAESVSTLSPRLSNTSGVEHVPPRSSVLRWKVNPENDSLTRYTVACTAHSSHVAIHGPVSRGALPVNTSTQTLKITVAGLAPGKVYECTLTLSDSGGQRFKAPPRKVHTSRRR